MLNRIAFDDAVGSGGLLARLKLVGELAKIKVGLKDVGDGPLAAVKRLKLASRANQIRVDLGAHAARAEPVAQQQEGAKPHLDVLLAVAQGQHDAEGLQALYERIKGAVEALDGMGALAGVAVEGANEAITHWAELEIKLNG